MEISRIEIAKLSLRPGDVLVARAAVRLSREQHQRLSRLFAGVLPDGVKTLVVDDSVDLSVLTQAPIGAA